MATSVCFGWAASALASAATYIADADEGRLALLGATGADSAGDWERILGAEFFDKVFLADRIASIVRSGGFVLWFAALGTALGTIAWNFRKVPSGGPAERWSRPRAAPAAPPIAVTDEEMWS
ncbi:MAG TPA: hypothetical protein VE800_04460 [Actinomycetota bacterium]|nr:hypothetical protein [Actinomycetota bacterium]